MKQEWMVTHTVTQLVETETPEGAERIARLALENSGGLWWPSVRDDFEVEPNVDDPARVTEAPDGS